MAEGKVGTGFSCPWVAQYSVSGTTVTYSDAIRLARGVSVSISPEVSDSEVFYADNVEAEEESGTFTGGTVKLTVDGLLQAAEQFIFGLEDADEDGFVGHGSTSSAPYVGIGFVRRYKSDGEDLYTPYILTKCKFVPSDEEAETAEDEVSWQTQELTANMFRDGSESRNWKLVGSDYTTESEAEEAIKSRFNYESE